MRASAGRASSGRIICGITWIGLGLGVGVEVGVGVGVGVGLRFWQDHLRHHLGAVVVQVTADEPE